MDDKVRDKEVQEAIDKVHTILKSKFESRTEESREVKRDNLVKYTEEMLESLVPPGSLDAGTLETGLVVRNPDGSWPIEVTEGEDGEMIISYPVSLSVDELDYKVIDLGYIEEEEE